MSQIKKKFIKNNAVDGTKIQLLNNQAFRAVDTAGLDRELFYFNSSNEWLFNATPKVSVDPLVDNDLVRKSYVDAKAQTEKTRAEAAESILRESIDEEIAARQMANVVLHGRVDTEEAARIAADASLRSAIDQEISDRQAAINNLQTEREATDSSVQAQLSSNAAAIALETTNRQAADAFLQGQITTEKGRIDAILSASSADYDSFAEIVSLINSVDTQNDNAFAAYVLSNNAAVAAEIAAREAADFALDARLDIIEGSDTVEGSIAKAEKDAKDYTDAAISAEESARMAADAAIQSELDSTQAGAGLGTNGSYTAPAMSNYLQMATSLKDADSKLDAALASEASTRASNDAANLAEAKAYTDTQISELVDGAPLLLDTLKELAAAIDNDENFATNIMTSIANEIAARQAADAAEAAARIAADAAEAAARQAATPQYAKVRFTLTATDISNGYVDLAHIVKPLSVNAFIDRLAIHEEDDYTLSVVAGKTRLTFAGVMTGEEGPEAGDLFRIGYAYTTGDQ